MRTKTYRYSRRYIKKNKSIKHKSIKHKSIKRKRSYRMKGGAYPLDQLDQIPPQKYIPYGGDIIGNFDYPEQAKNTPNGALNSFFRGGKRKSLLKHHSKKNSLKHKRFRGGSIMSIIPQQLVNTGRGVSQFFADKVNGYQGYPSQPSYLPYDQPIDRLSNSELIDYY